MGSLSRTDRIWMWKVCFVLPWFSHYRDHFLDLFLERRGVPIRLPFFPNSQVTNHRRITKYLLMRRSATQAAASCFPHLALQPPCVDLTRSRCPRTVHDFLGSQWEGWIRAIRFLTSTLHQLLSQSSPHSTSPTTCACSQLLSHTCDCGCKQHVHYPALVRLSSTPTWCYSPSNLTPSTQIIRLSRRE